jgi:hypothetical protein
VFTLQLSLDGGAMRIDDEFSMQNPVWRDGFLTGFGWGVTIMAVTCIILILTVFK